MYAYLNQKPGFWFLLFLFFAFICVTLTGISPVSAQDACTVIPTMESVASGSWNDPNTWNTGTIPGKGDWVSVKPGHTLIMPGFTDIAGGGICNNGTLQSSTARMEIRAASVHNSGDIIGKNGRNGTCKRKYRERCKRRWFNKKCWWEVSGVTVRHSTPGASIQIHTANFINDTTGKIQAGNGGHDIMTCWDRVRSHGGAGGRIEIFSPAFVNEGIFQTGNGGNAASYHTTSTGGSGGDVRIIADVSDPRIVSKNTGFLIAGNGGSARSQRGYSKGGKGGNLDLFLKRLGGNIVGANGSRFWWDPATLKAESSLKIQGYDEVAIYTDQGGTIDLSQLSKGAISDARTITIATKASNGKGGTVDLRGLSENVFSAGKKLEIYADKILMDDGISFDDLTDAPTTDILPGRAFYRVILSVDKRITGNPGDTISVPLTVINSGSKTDTYKLGITDSAGWNMGILPDTVTVDGFQAARVSLDISFPEVPDETNIITITAVSQANPIISADTEIMAAIFNPDNPDPDWDNDGVPDGQDDFPLDPNETLDSDEDGTGDNADPDDDNDSMTDEWETQFGLDPFVNDTTEDPDNDGYSNLQEYNAKTDPGDPVSHPSLKSGFTEGVFTVGKNGEVRTDWLFDGGSYKGELGIFSLSGMENLEPNSPEFVKQAATRALSGTVQGHVVLSDSQEGARFSGQLGACEETEEWNSGPYKGLKTFTMMPGDRFAMILVPSGSFQALLKNPGRIQPIFSLASPNPDHRMYFGQLAKIGDMENVFVFEDRLLSENSDRDYNDLVIQIRGVSVSVPTLDNPRLGLARDWRVTDTLVIPHIEVSPPDPGTFWMTIILKSPADLLVYDPMERVIGKEGGNILGALFETDKNGHQVVSLPATESGDYRVVLQGRGNGGLCHLEIKGYIGKSELSSKQIPFEIKPHQTLATTVSADSFLSTGEIDFEPPKVPVSPEGRYLAYDFDGDGDIDVADVMKISSKWEAKTGEENYDAFYDLDDDGSIRLSDIMEVVNFCKD